MSHYEQVRHAISARKHSLGNIIEGITNRKNKVQDENHEAEEKMIHRLRQMEETTQDMISYCENIENALRREV
ncbi:hypothetical protein [Listeria cornellensis]|uniref:Uncharacterized protein n=1 Tax=Listeria cornellensis FSL F6-0969 TaxID=1265820 RepID=W7BN49_9LIST|nr:hypothetical protein [Listeria cornellensis]EUJ27307.1 hypothetical protein PCORN_13287 [Listeria cornellensis FSL F6-0969]